MIDPELKNHLEKIEDDLAHMRNVSTGLWHTLWRGCVYGAGYVIGALIVIVIIGWILNLVESSAVSLGSHLIFAWRWKISPTRSSERSERADLNANDAVKRYIR